MNDDWLSFDLIEGVGEDVPNDDDPKWKSSEGWGDGKFRATKCSWLNQDQVESINHAYSLSVLPSRIILKSGSFKTTKNNVCKSCLHGVLEPTSLALTNCCCCSSVVPKATCKEKSEGP